MKIRVKVYGEIQKVSQSEYAVQVLGKIDTVTLDSKYCDTQSTFFFQNPYHGVVIEGVDLKTKNHENDKVVISGTVFAIKFLNEDGEAVKRYNIRTCCIEVTEVPEEDPIEEDEDILDDSFFEQD